MYGGERLLERGWGDKPPPKEARVNSNHTVTSHTGNVELQDRVSCNSDRPTNLAPLHLKLQHARKQARETRRSRVLKLSSDDTLSFIT